jgi:hypothetical protein
MGSAEQCAKLNKTKSDTWFVSPKGATKMFYKIFGVLLWPKQRGVRKNKYKERNTWFGDVPCLHLA